MVRKGPLCVQDTRDSPLPPFGKTVDEEVRQAVGPHLLLGGRDVVLSPVVEDGTSVGVVYDVAGPGITVPRLPYPTGIDYQAVRPQADRRVQGEVQEHGAVFVGAA